MTELVTDGGLPSGRVPVQGQAIRDSVFPQHPLVRRPWFIRLAIDDAGQESH